MYEGAEGFQAVLEALGGNGTRGVTICKRSPRKNRVTFNLLAGDIGAKLHLIRNDEEPDV